MPQTSAARAALGLGLLAAVSAAFNLIKPVQIDDAAYLAIVKWIPLHPLHPLAGVLNWNQSAEPFSALNQPVLYIYLEALVWAVFGPSVLALHVLMAAVSSAVVIMPA